MEKGLLLCVADTSNGHIDLPFPQDGSGQTGHIRGGQKDNLFPVQKAHVSRHFGFDEGNLTAGESKPMRLHPR